MKMSSHTAEVEMKKEEAKEKRKINKARKAKQEPKKGENTIMSTNSRMNQ